jgi:hypothetical protein
MAILTFKKDLLVKHFNHKSIRTNLENKRLHFLQLALDAYILANIGNNLINDNKEESNQEECVADNQASTEGSSMSSSEKNSSTGKRTVSNEQEDDHAEQWLHHYMLGKIKEKLKPFEIMEPLNHYFEAAKHLEKNNAIYMKRLTYKTKGTLSVESNEMFYRIYALTLKKLDRLSVRYQMNEISATELINFLEKVIEAKFVKIHNDFQIDEISQFIRELFAQSSERINKIKFDQEIFIRCVCICVAGLNQILKRFSQHYRSQYRLAYFYSKFLDLKHYEFSKNILLSVPNWNQLPYMTSPGLFHEKNKVNFFNGIWRISNNSNKDQDLERGGSFLRHLFEIVRLLIETLEKTKDFTNLIELSRCLYLKPDNPEKYFFFF